LVPEHVAERVSVCNTLHSIMMQEKMQ
jgi:hypothetical protein